MTSIREQELRLALAELDAEYRRRAEPILRELAAIESVKPPKPICFEIDPGFAKAMSQVLLDKPCE